MNMTNTTSRDQVADYLNRRNRDSRIALPLTRRVTVGATLGAWILLLALSGCYRSSPPTISKFKPPAEPAKKQAAPTETVADAPAPDIEEPIPVEDEIPTPVEVRAVPTPPPAPEPELEPQAPPAPTIVGTWRCVDMVHNGQSMPMPEGMEMTLTFAADGGVAITTAGGPMPEPMSRQGTYSVSGDQITISMDNETKTGTLTFEGNTRATLEIDEGRLVLARA